MNIAAFGSLPLSACALGAQGSDGPDRISKNFYDAAGRVWQVKTALGIAGEEANEVTRTFTDNGLVKTVTDGENNKTTYEYDGLDRLEKTYFPVPNPKGADTSNGADYEQSTYESLAGGARTSPLVVAFRNRGNQTVNFGYDALGRQTLKDLPGTEPDVTYGYDLLGRLTSASQTGQALGFTWDALGRVRDQTGPLGTVASEWDLAGRRKKLTWPDGFFRHLRLSRHGRDHRDPRERRRIGHRGDRRLHLRRSRAAQEPDARQRRRHPIYLRRGVAP
jgi:YD repeat-containing protein